MIATDQTNPNAPSGASFHHKQTGIMNKENTARFGLLGMTLLQTASTEQHAIGIYIELDRETEHTEKCHKEGWMTDEQKDEAIKREMVRALQRLESLAEHHGINV